MVAGARTPEELDALLEDAFVLRDRDAFEALFDDNAVLAQSGGSEFRGREAIGRALAALRAYDCIYVAAPDRVLQSGETALVIADGAIHVLRRDSDGVWRATITLLHLDHPIKSEDP